jgi:hypothetical protein
MRAETPSSVSRKRGGWSGFTNSWNRSFEGGSRRARVFALMWVGTFKKDRPGIGRAPRESDFWYPWDVGDSPNCSGHTTGLHGVRLQTFDR